MKILIPLFFLSFTVLLFPQNFKMVKIYIDSREDISRLAAFNIDLETAELTKDNAVQIFLSESEFARLNLLPYRYEILIDDWLAYYASLPKLTGSEKSSIVSDSKEKYNVDGFGFGSMGGYYTYQEIVNQMDSMYIRFPGLITQKYSIGTSQLGRTIWAAKISDNPDINENEPQALFDALIHAREPQSMATVMYFMYYLLENYGSNPEVTYLVNNREIYFVPCLNPDGYEYNRTTAPNGGGMWRKNRRNNSSSDGVDLNRNFGYKWGYDNVGSSGVPSEETYRGPSAFSEPEALAIRNLAIAKNFKTYINYHSYNNSIIYPWGYINRLTPDSLEFIEFASYMSQFNGYDYGTSYQTLAYNSNGTARDYMYGEQTEKGKVYGYTFEVGTSSDGFWPPQSRIFPLAQGNIRPNLFQAWMAGEYVGLQNYSLTPQYVSPGDNAGISFTVKNKGLATAYNVNAVLSSNDPYITVPPNSVTVDSIPARRSVNSATPVSFYVAPNAPVGREIVLLLKMQNSQIVFSTDTIKFYTGVPLFAFKDTTNNPSSLWTITASPATPTWEATTSSFISGPNSYTDSKSGSYSNNATVTLALTNQINMSGLVSPKLTYWTKFDMEATWDCGVVMISANNGSTWSALTGRYTKPASGSGKQVPAGMPIYHSVQSTWVKEEIDLSSYAGNQIKIKFELRTDGSQVRDGWYIDDIGIYELGLLPVELTSFTASESEGNVTLKWSTASELNNKGFLIDNSGDGTNWKNVAFINGAGTSNERHNYSFTDLTPAKGESFYRLSQTDYDGTVRICGILNVNSSAPFRFSLDQNYPNPFNPSTKIKYSVSGSRAEQVSSGVPVTLKVYDILGREVASLVNQAQAPGTYEVEFDAGDLASGVYVYKLVSGSQTAVRKFVINK